MELSAANIRAIIGAAILVIDLIIRIALIFYIPRNRKPTAALSWLLAIYILPVFGTILFFVIGNNKLSRLRRQHQIYMSKKLKAYAKTFKHTKLFYPVETKYRTSAILAEKLGDLPPVKGNKVEIVSGYNRIIRNMTEAIDTAEHYVYVEFFAMALDETTMPFYDAMERAVKRGVRVYVLFDTLGSYRYKGFKKMKQHFTRIGVHWHKMLPINLRPRQYDRPDLRNHRKIVVIDNSIAFLGSLNMIEKTYQRKDDIRYLELTSRMEGPVVNQCAAIFASDWFSETGHHLDDYVKAVPKKIRGGRAVAQVLPSGPGYIYENNLKLFVSLIYSARRSIVITNPYFVPDQSLLSAITSATQRGVKVTLLNSEAMDQWMVGYAQRSYYEQIMNAGVEIHLYKKPILNHSKYMVVDQQVAVVGSSNLDIRSFELDLECVSIFYDKTVSRTLHRLHTRQLIDSHLLTHKEWNQRSKFAGLVDGLARMTSALQ